MPVKRTLACALACTLLLPAQKHFELTIDNIMRGPGLYGYEPSGIRWSGDHQRIFFQWKQASDPPIKPMDTYVVNRDGTGLRKLDDPEQAPPVSGNRTRDRKKVAYALDGDIFVYDFSTSTRRQLTKTTDVESNPQFAHDENHVAFTRGANLYVLSLETGMLEQVTEVTTTPEPDKKGTDSQEILKKQERELIQSVSERAQAREEEEAKRKKVHPRKSFVLQARQSIDRIDLCPDEKCAIAMVTEAGEKTKSQVVPAYVTESAYAETLQGRTNVGDIQPHLRAVILDATTGEAKWVDPGLKDREVEMEPPIWNEAGRRAVLMARAADNKDRWILALEPETGKTRVLFTEHDDAWLGGPGEETLGWLKSGNEIYFQSERDGFSHLYVVSFDGGQPKQLTSGTFEVSSIRLSNDGTRFYLTTSEAGPGERHFYSMNVTGGPRTKLTSEPGSHRVTLSPDEKSMADVYSYTNKPPELFVDGKKLTSSPAAEFWNYAWLDVPIVQVPARDGAMIPARFYKPAGYRPGGPAVVFVHGAGYLQNVHRYWSSYSHEYLFHHFLMEHGYMVLDMDYRASAGYGRDWRTAIYRHMGGKDLDDNVDGAKWLAAQGADPKRIGIYGGSYGGFITLMAMFTTPEVFAAGAALRPVTDWSHYNHGYTSNILNLPQKDAEAYKVSSPIYYAAGLKGALLICHGMVDTNVFFQDSVRLAQRLIELRKQNWSFAAYPVENHTFVEPSSWADEYKRIFELFEANLKR
jgi:dipeptidyl aminopeptidase/acylaminoacyl peptidase